MGDRSTLNQNVKVKPLLNCKIIFFEKNKTKKKKKRGKFKGLHKIISKKNFPNEFELMH